MNKNSKLLDNASIAFFQQGAICSNLLGVFIKYGSKMGGFILDYVEVFIERPKLLERSN